MSGKGGVWVYKLSEDLREITNYYRLGEAPVGNNIDMVLVSWWVVGESILVLDGESASKEEWLSNFWRAPAVWSLLERNWITM